MKNFFLSLFLLLYSLIAKADYGYRALPELILEAENCVVGRIVNVDADYFHLKVERLLFGKAEQDTLKIIKFRDWGCGQRYDEYRIGQREIVCFHKSNNVIPEYELIGYGMGCESEIQVTRELKVNYQYAYGRFHTYPFREFVAAVRDYKQLSMRVQNGQTQINPDSVIAFGRRSEVHKYLIQWNDFELHRWYDEDEFGVLGKEGKLKNGRIKGLYQNTENKVKIDLPELPFGQLFVKADHASVQKKKDFFIIKPVHARTGDRIYVYKIAHADTIILFSRVYETYKVPEPTVYIDNSTRDTFSPSAVKRGLPDVNYDLGNWKTEDRLNYDILKFGIEISTGDSVFTVHCRSRFLSHELRTALKQVKEGSRIRYFDITVLYPDGQVKKVKDKMIYVGKDN